MARSNKTRSGERQQRTAERLLGTRMDHEYEEIGSAGRSHRGGEKRSTRIKGGGRGAAGRQERRSVLEDVDSDRGRFVTQPSGTPGLRGALRITKDQAELAEPDTQPRGRRASPTPRNTKARRRAEKAGEKRSARVTNTTRARTTSGRGKERGRMSGGGGASRGRGGGTTRTAGARVGSARMSGTGRGQAKAQTGRNRAGSRTATARRTGGRRTTARR